MIARHELVLHRILSACALVAAVAALALARPDGTRAQERVSVACACGTACACAASHPAGGANTGEPAPDLAAKLLAARRASNEASAIATLRSLASGQAQFQASTLVDGDADGIGEYGYCGELAGTHAMRSGTGRKYGIGPATIDLPVLPASFGKIEGGAIARTGYHYRVFLPDAAGQGVSERETGGANPARLPDPDRCEVLWCAYAWPTTAGESGERAFFINQEGDILQTANTKRT